MIAEVKRKVSIAQEHQDYLTNSATQTFRHVIEYLRVGIVHK